MLLFILALLLNNLFTPYQEYIKIIFQLINLTPSHSVFIEVLLRFGFNRPLIWSCDINSQLTCVKNHKFGKATCAAHSIKSRSLILSIYSFGTLIFSSKGRPRGFVASMITASCSTVSPIEGSKMDPLIPFKICTCFPA